MPEKTVRVPNISCGPCKADQASKEVTVRWTEAGAPWEAIAVHLADIGYPAEEPAGVAGPRG